MNHHFIPERVIAMRHEFESFLSDILMDGKKSGAFPAAAAAIGQGREVFAKAFVGNAPEPDGVPVDENTRWDMASVSKIIGPTMIALQAIEQGRLKLTQCLGDFFSDCPADKQKITIEHLMTHTSGITPHFRLDLCGIKPEEAATRILREPLLDTPGVRPNYSCMGYILLGKILESIYGMPLKDLAGKIVFDPLKMDRTCYCPDPEDGVYAATEIDPATGKPWIGIVHDENARFLGGNSANAGVFMPLTDFIKYAQMLACGGEGIISRETLDFAIINRTPGFDVYRGLGFQISGTELNFLSPVVPPRTYGHNGFTGTSLLIEPDSGFWVCLLTNRVYPTRESNGIFPFRRRIHEESWRLFSNH